MFAVIKTGGKQYRVAADDVIRIDKVAGNPGDIIEIGEVLLVGGDEVSFGAPAIADATVAGEVLEQGRGAKVIAFKKRRRQNSRRKRGHRQEFTLLRITEILTGGAKPDKTARPKPERKPKEPKSADAAGGDDEADDAVPAKTPAKAKKSAKKPARAKPATKGKKK